MLWRVCQATHRLRGPLLVSRAWVTPRVPPPSVPALVAVRCAGHLIPPSQYQIPISPKFKLGYALRVYWELIPVIVTICISLLILAIHIIWACQNKVDAVFSTHSCNNISRTMNLRRPTVHKMFVINQRYEPWPEMQDVIDKLAVAERRALLKATQCSYEQREGHPPPELQGLPEQEDPENDILETATVVRTERK